MIEMNFLLIMQGLPWESVFGDNTAAKGWPCVDEVDGRCRNKVCSEK